MLLDAMKAAVVAGRLRARSISETFILTGSNTDILKAASRIQAAPENCLAVIEVSATDCDGTNYGSISVTTPAGISPELEQRIPANGYSQSEAVLHAESLDRIEVPIQQGGHLLLQYTETGTVTAVAVRVTIYF